jgi:hypothetical protein
MSWQGPEDIRPRSPKRLAVRVNKHILPDRYGTLKEYGVADEHILELLEDSVDDIEALIFGAGVESEDENDGDPR